jgi:general secretion pathway protein A
VYLQYFGLKEAPFSITPDPVFVFLSQRHRDALAHLLYGVGQGGSGGFVQLTGEVGTGKTTLCRVLLEQVPDDTRIALVLNPLMTPSELLAAICEELAIDISGVESSSKALVDRLNHFLLKAHEAGECVVVVIDEAQNLSPESLEQVRLLTNLETSKQKLLQIVLLGQPELRELLQRRSLRQLAQRITARYHLTPLGPVDTAKYVRHRMQVAGAVRNPFRNSALKALYRRSHGVPRLINIIADRALVGAYAGECQSINAKLVRAAADEVQLGEPGVRREWWRWYIAATAGLLLALLTWNALRPVNNETAGTVAVIQDAGSTNQPTAITGRVTEENPPADIPAAKRSHPVDLDEAWLDLQDRGAWQGLATLWNEPGSGEAIKSACRDGHYSGWACLRGDGSLARITQLGLPVLLQLQGTGPDLLLLQGIDGDRLLVGKPGTALTVSRLAIEDRWFGGFMAAWPQAEDWPREITTGDEGPAVDTVLHLAGLADQAYSGPAVFGVEFEGWLIGFQQKYGLKADGIVGPRTLLYLIRPSISDPELKSDWQEAS